MRRLASQSVISPHDNLAITQRRLPVLMCRLHRHKRFIDQGVMRIRVTQRTGNRQNAIATPKIRHPRRTQIFGQVRQKRPRADIQALAAEDVGVVD